MTDTDFAQAVKHHQEGRLAEAAAIYERILEGASGHAEARRLLGVTHLQRGNAADAERLLRETIAADPTNAKAYDNLAHLLHSQGRDEEALPASRRAAELAPTSDAILYNLGNLFVDVGRTVDAIDALRRALAANPGHTAAHQRLGAELLKTGDAPAALRHLNACIASGDVNSAILAAKAVALAEVGDIGSLNSLMDYDRLVLCRHIGEAHGYPSLAEFNAALAAYVGGNSTLHEEQTTVNGFDTAANLLDAAEPCIAALRRFVYDAIESRLRSLPENHLFATLAPRHWRTESWGVKMWRQGHQVTHIHQKAWLSGVYYVQLPDIVRPGQKGHDGWIEFGRGPDDLYAVARPETRLIQPVEGMLITFPSYVWHRTIPFESAHDRISIAFDVIPTA